MECKILPTLQQMLDWQDKKAAIGDNRLNSLAILHHVNMSNVIVIHQHF
jgi:hypothetical protein